MELSLTLTLSLVAALLLLEGFFSGCELGLASFPKVRLRHLAESGLGYARTLERLLRHPEQVFGTTSVGTNLAVFTSSSLVTAYLAGVVSRDADALAFLIMGPLTLVLGEIAPKIIFRNNAGLLWPLLARPLAWAQALFTPALAVTTRVARFVLRHLLRQRQARATLTTREEILILTQGAEAGLGLDTDEKKMIDRIFEFKTNTVDSAMRPLIMIAAVPDTTTIEQARVVIARTGFSRLPVFHERVYNIIGIINAFDILRHRDGSLPAVTLMSQAHYVPATTRNAALLKEMQERGLHMAVVVDEYGAAVGIVTIEDLLEEIVGDIEDEYDEQVKSFEKKGPGVYIIDAAMEVDAINDQLGLDLPTGDFETLAGFLTEAVERIPRKRERLASGPYVFTVLDADSRKVISVEVRDTRANAPSAPVDTAP